MAEAKKGATQAYDPYPHLSKPSVEEVISWNTTGEPQPPGQDEIWGKGKSHVTPGPDFEAEGR